MRDIVLFCVEGYQHLEVSKKLAETLKESGHRSSIFYPHVVDNDEPLAEFEHYIREIKAVPGYLKRVALVISFTNETSPNCPWSNLVSYVARKTGTAVVTIQHGWLQPGLNYESGLKKVGFTRGADNSHAMAHFGTQVSWSGDDGIGYFAYEEGTEIVLPKARQDRYSALICTNLNSTVYSQEQTFQFLRCISRLRDAFPYIRFYHRGHPAEDSVAEFQRLGMLDLAPYLMHSPSSPYPMSSSLIGMDFVITTPSTSALDCIANGVPVFLFEENNFIGKMNDFDGALFRSHGELISLVRNLISDGEYPEPKIKPFSRETFIEIVETEASKSAPFGITEELLLNFYALVKSEQA